MLGEELVMFFKAVDMIKVFSDSCFQAFSIFAAHEKREFVMEIQDIEKKDNDCSRENKRRKVYGIREQLLECHVEESVTENISNQEVCIT